jgi:hypothetical protein
MAGISRSWSMGDNFWLRNYYFGLLRKERRFTVVWTQFSSGGESMSEGAS